MRLYLLKHNNHLSANDYSLEEQELVYDEQLSELLANPRWYLDNLNTMVEYRVCWANYRSCKPVVPHRYCKKKGEVFK